MNKILAFILLISSSIFADANAASPSAYALMCGAQDVTLSWLDRELPPNPETQQQARLFFSLLGDKVRSYLEQNRNALFTMSECLAGKKTEVLIDTATVSCKPTLDFFQKNLPTLVKLSRYELAMAVEPFTGGPLDFKKLNSRLFSPSDFRVKQAHPLTQAELAELTPYWNSELQKIEAQTKVDVEEIKKSREVHDEVTLFNSLYAQRVRRLRVIHHANYRTYLQNLPLLSTLQSADPQYAEITFGIQWLINNNFKELNFVREQQQLILSKAQIESSTLSMIKYTPLAMEVLAKDKRLCLVAAISEKVISNRDLQLAALGVPLLIGGFFIPPIWALGVGATAAGFWYLRAQDQYQQDLQSALIGAFGSEAILPLEKVRDYKSEVNFQILTMPLVFIGGPSFKSMAKTSLRALSNLKSHLGIN